MSVEALAGPEYEGLDEQVRATEYAIRGIIRVRLLREQLTDQLRVELEEDVPDLAIVKHLKERLRQLGKEEKDSLDLLDLVDPDLTDELTLTN